MKKVLLVMVGIVLVFAQISLGAKKDKSRPSQGKRPDQKQIKGKAQQSKKRVEKRKDKVKRDKQQQVKTEKGKADDTVGKAKAQTADKTKAGKKHAQRLKAIEKQLDHENAKHLNRKSRLDRLRQLAVEKDNSKAIERIDKLIAKEQGRYDKKIERIGERKQRAMQSAESKLDKKKNKGKKKDKPEDEENELDED